MEQGDFAIGKEFPDRDKTIPVPRGVEPDRQRATALERFIEGRRVPGLVDWGAAYQLQLISWDREMNPSRALRNKAPRW